MYFFKMSGEKQHISVSVVGHVDSGKSTTTGRLIYELGGISERDMEKLKQRAHELGKDSFAFAFYMDTQKEEQERGITISCTTKEFFTEKYHYTIVDCPGHRDFIPNMITGAAQADFAILVIDTDNFESSFVGGGQTKEHAYIVRSFGVHKLIVAMNKMDRIGWNVEKFINIKHRLTTYLTKIGFDEDSIIYMPISAINAVNITKKNMIKF